MICFPVAKRIFTVVEQFLEIISFVIISALGTMFAYRTRITLVSVFFKFEQVRIRITQNTDDALKIRSIFTVFLFVILNDTFSFLRSYLYALGT